MGEQHPSFEITVGGRDVSLEIGRCAVALFRTQQEVQYLAVDLDDEQTLRIFNNSEFAEWVAGYRLEEHNGVLDRPTVYTEYHGQDRTFREITGWSPVTIEKETPSDTEIEMWLDINASDIDEGLTELLG